MLFSDDRYGISYYCLDCPNIILSVAKVCLHGAIDIDVRGMHPLGYGLETM